MSPSISMSHLAKQNLEPTLLLLLEGCFTRLAVPVSCDAIASCINCPFLSCHADLVTYNAIAPCSTRFESNPFKDTLDFDVIQQNKCRCKWSEEFDGTDQGWSKPGLHKDWPDDRGQLAAAKGYKDWKSTLAKVRSDATCSQARH